MLARTKPPRWLPTLVGTILLLLAGMPLSAKDRRLEKFFSDIVVLPNGNVDVTENITFRFIGGPWQGIYRTIPGSTPARVASITHSFSTYRTSATKVDTS